MKDNGQILAPISKGELFETLTHMHSDKSLGPGDFNSVFYQNFWGLCGDDIFEVVTIWMERGFFPYAINDTNIYLIPKCENPKNMKDLRPILLCNMVYKMVSKLLANIMKKCLA